MLSFPQLLEQVQQRRAAGAKVVSTNGCFDLLHIGHMTFLQQARAAGDLLIVGLNSDGSIRRLKGAGRPIIPETDRVHSLLALQAVDYVFVYDDLLANPWLAQLQPDIHCKAGEYTVADLPETPVITAYGGEVRIIPVYGQISTSFIVNRINNGPAEQEHGGANDFAMECLLRYSHTIRQMALCQGARINEIARRLRLNIDAHGMLFSYADPECLTVANYFHAVCAADSHTLASATPIPINEQAWQQCAPDARGLLFAFTPHASASMQAVLSLARQHGIVSILLTGPVEGEPELADITLTIPSEHPASLAQAQIALVNVWLEVFQTSEEQLASIV